jgi:peptidoglycan/LPS O-acetylase OafA/YrhL
VTTADRYRPDIDGLRAIAVLLVIGFHAAPALVPGGFIGVDIFFVISGYLIAGLIQAELDQGRFSALLFYARRCRRIVPALAVVLVATWGLGWLEMFADEFENLGKHIIGGAGFAANMVLASETGYFDPRAETKPLLHLWSLGIEEQFYLVWPMVAMLVFRRRYPAGVVLGALSAASLLLYLLAWRFDPVLAFYLLPTRFWEILAGAGLAYFERSRGVAAPGVALPLVAAAMVLAAAFGLDAGALPAYLLPLVAVVAALMIIRSGRNAGVVAALLASRPAVFVGLISYPLYLWHWPLLTFVRLAIPEGEPLAPQLAASAIVAAFVLATLTWLLVERPLRIRVFPIERNRHAAGWCLASGGAALGLLALLGAATLAKEGMPGRLDGFFSAHARPVESEVQWQRKQYVDAECQRTERFREAQFCRRSGEPLVVAMIGDSHANHLMPGLIDVLGAEAIGIIHVGEGGCPGLPGVRVVSSYGKQMCAPDFRGYLDFVISRAEIRYVLIASRVSLYTDPAAGYRLSEDGTSTSNMQALTSGYSRLIAKLRAAGKEVIVLTEVPRLGFHPRDCVASRPFGLGVRRPCVQAADAARLDAGDELVRTLRSSDGNLAVFDIGAMLCHRGECAAMANGELLYRDPGHLSVAGSRRVAAQLRSALLH